MRLVKFGLLLMALVLINSFFVSAQNKKEGVTDWNVICVDGFKKGEVIPCEGFQSSGGNFSITREFLTNWSMASSSVSLTFIPLEEHPLNGLKVVGVTPKPDEDDKNWEYKFVGNTAGPGGGDGRWFVRFFFYCKNPQNQGNGNTGYCADGSYTGELKLRDERSDAIYTVTLTVNVKTLKSKK